MPNVPTTDGISHPLAAGYDLRLNNTLWQLAPTTEEAVDVIPVDQSAETVLRAPENPEDFGVPPDERAFSRESFAGGEGLARAHRRDSGPDDWSRFWSSEGIEVEPTQPGDPEELRLAPRADHLDEYPGASHLSMTVIDASLFVARDNAITVGRYDSPTNPLAGSTEEAVGTGNIIALERLGRELYACSDGEGIYRRTSAGVWGVFLATFDADRLWAAKLRILGRSQANPHELYEVASGGEILLVSLTAGSVWNDVEDAGEFILAAGSDGFVYAIGEEAGALQLEAQNETEGEEPVSLGVAQGVVFIGTRQRTPGGGYIGRLWRAEMNGPRFVNAQVLRTWGDMDTTEDWTPSEIRTTRDTALIYVRDRIWHYHVAQAGLHSWMAAPSGPGSATDLTVLGGRTYAAVIYDSGNPAVLFQTTEVTTSGYLITPAVDFFTSQPKDWVGLSVFHNALTTSTQRIRVYYTTDPNAITDPDHLSWKLALTRIGPSAPIEAELPMIGVRSRWLALKIVLETGTGQPSPELRGFTVRASPTIPDVHLALPINISDWVDSPWRIRRRAPGLGRIRTETLFGFRGATVEAELYRRNLTVRGRVVGLSEPETVTTPGGAATLRAVMVVKGRVTSATAATSSVTGATYGVPMYGESLFGGG